MPTRKQPPERNRRLHRSDLQAAVKIRHPGSTATAGNALDDRYAGRADLPQENQALHPAPNERRTSASVLRLSSVDDLSHSTLT